MRTFEFILLILVTILPFVKRQVISSVKPLYVIGALSFLLLSHLIFEGWRWQMGPVYLLILILVWRITSMNHELVKLSFLRIVGYVGILLLAAIGWVLPQVLPVFSLPVPGGPHPVGTVSIHHVTKTNESITATPNDKREFMYKVWYPGEGPMNDFKRDVYVDEGSRHGFATKYGLPANALHYLDRVKTHVYQHLPIAKGEFPVLIFSHGYGSKATGYYALLTESPVRDTLSSI